MADSDLLESAYSNLDLPHKLRDYQWQGISFLFRSDSALLADEMGLGKTVQAAIALAITLAKPDMDRALVVVPAALVLNWERELACWCPRLVVRRVEGSVKNRQAMYLLPIQVLIASYEQIRTDGLDKIPYHAFDVVVLDEAQRIKNYSSQTALACRLLPRRRSWALTGTPIENSRGDLQSIFSFVKHGLLSSNMPKSKMLAKVEPYLLRRTKGQVLPSLPPIIYQDIIVDLSPQQRATYDEVWQNQVDQLAGEPRPVATTVLLAIITKLKQICNRDQKTGESSKFDVVQTVVESLSSSVDKVVLFSQYVETLEWIASKLEDVPYGLYHGGLSAEVRDRVISTFEDSPGPRAILISLRAGGVGLNLPSASVVILFDRWWNPAVENQAVYRAHRFERSGPLHVIRFVVRDTIEERICEILKKKQQIFTEYVEEASNAEVTPLTRGEIAYILGINKAQLDNSTTLNNMQKEELHG